MRQAGFGQQAHGTLGEEKKKVMKVKKVMKSKSTNKLSSKPAPNTVGNQMFTNLHKQQTAQQTNGSQAKQIVKSLIDSRTHSVAPKPKKFLDDAAARSLKKNKCSPVKKVVRADSSMTKTGPQKSHQQIMQDFKNDDFMINRLKKASDDLCQPTERDELKSGKQKLGRTRVADNANDQLIVPESFNQFHQDDGNQDSDDSVSEKRAI